MRESCESAFSSHRRAFFQGSAGILGSVALQALLAGEAGAREDAGHHPASADAVIWLFQHGGPSQVDLFDPKPELTRRNGRPHPNKLEAHFHTQQGNCLASPFRFSPQGECGMELSEILPRTAGIADDITLVRSLTTTSVDHESALRLIHGGKFQAGYPTLGSWVLYGLGSPSRDLPGYVVLSDPGGLPVDGVRNWSSGWLPAVYQGTAFRPGEHPVANLASPTGVSGAARERQLRLLRGLNAVHRGRYPENTELAARIENFERAARMQTAVPEALDLRTESAETRKLYGLDDAATAEYGARCLVARRLVERGVRFVQLFLAGQPWDTHSKNAETLRGLCRRIEGPSAALVKDLKRRGLLKRTIVIWGGEFGRLPISQGPDGRDHNRHANSIWIAGGGFKRGYVHGATDEFGYAAAQDAMTVHDLHATLLHALGLHPERLAYPHEGRSATLADSQVTGARIIRQLLA